MTGNGLSRGANIRYHRVFPVAGELMTELLVPDMTCAHCQASIEKAVAGLDPKAKVNVDLSTHRVSIDSAVASDRLLQAIRDAGFEPSLSDA